MAHEEPRFCTPGIAHAEFAQPRQEAGPMSLAERPQPLPYNAHGFIVQTLFKAGMVSSATDPLSLYVHLAGRHNSTDNGTSMDNCG